MKFDDGMFPLLKSYACINRTVFIGKPMLGVHEEFICTSVSEVQCNHLQSSLHEIDDIFSSLDLQINPPIHLVVEEIIHLKYFDGY